MTESEVSMRISNEVYDKLKYLCLIVLPALATFYGALSKIWGLPYGTEIPMTITAIGTFMGVCLKVSTDNYHKEGDAE